MQLVCQGEHRSLVAHFILILSVKFYFNAESSNGRTLLILPQRNKINRTIQSTLYRYWSTVFETVGCRFDSYLWNMDKDSLKLLADLGGSKYSIAEELGCSPSKVQYWLGRYGIRTKWAEQRKQNAEAKGAKYIDRTCSSHGETGYRLEGGRYRCIKCGNASKRKWRKDIKSRLVADLGGECIVCGYNDHLCALEFHHLDPAQKDFSIGSVSVRLSYDKLIAEAKKCVLLCSTHHREVEANVRAI
jgi:hypothetical protein